MPVTGWRRSFSSRSRARVALIPASPAYLRLARELTTASGALLVFDEIQSGIGRTGDWFAFQDADVVPDAFTLAKGLAGGVPIGALVTVGSAVTGLLTPGQHGSTFGGATRWPARPAWRPCAPWNPTVSSRMPETWAITSPRQCWRCITRWSSRCVVVPGLLRAIVLREEVAATVASRALEAGFLVNAVARRRFALPRH